MEGIKEYKNSGSIWLLFILWPLMLLLASIRNLRESWAKNGIWLFIIFLGFTFVPQEGNDSTRYIEWFQDFHNSNNDFSQFIKYLYSEGTRYVDVLQPLITYLLAKFTDDYRILFAVFGLIFGFFYSRNLAYLIAKTEGVMDGFLILIIIAFSLVVPPWSINGVRFWTAAHIFLYGALLTIIDSKAKGLIIAILAIFMHFSFIFPFTVLLLYLLIKEKTSVLFIFFISTCFITEINIPLVRSSLIKITPRLFHERILSYTSDTKIEETKDKSINLNWYVQWHERALKLSLEIMLFIIFFSGRTVWVKIREIKRLFSFVLLFGGFANLFGQIPSVGRFISVWALFALCFIFLYLYYSSEKILEISLFKFLIPGLLLFIVVSIRIGFDNTGINTIISNPIIAPFIENKTALIDLIK